MSNSCTVLPAPKLLNLISVRAAENAITLVARTSSREPRPGWLFVRYEGRAPPRSILITPGCWLTCPDREPPLLRILTGCAAPGFSAAQAAGILVKSLESCSEEELRALGRSKTVHPAMEKCYSLFEEFSGMLRDKGQRSREQARSRLKEWTERAKASEVPELKAFTVKLLQDADAVVAAMILHYSQGQAEGQVNKLKFIKRSIYGRGKFDLLKQRVLYDSAA